MYAWLAWLVYALRATRTPLFIFACPSTVLSYMFAAQGCIYASRMGGCTYNYLAIL